MYYLLIGFGSAALAALIVWLILRANHSRKLMEAQMNLRSSEEKTTQYSEKISAQEDLLNKKDEDLNTLREEKSGLSSKIASLETRLEEERKTSAEKLKLLEDAREKLSDAFKALSQEALKSTSDSFLQLAETRFKNIQTEAKGELEQRKQAVENLVNPIKESLEKYQKWLQETENIRQKDYGSITAQLKALAEMEKNLSQETTNLVTALKAPQVRGSWGEQTLHRVVELAGLTEHCDFVTQESVSTAEGRLRPDLVVRMPGDRVIIVDAKNIFHNYYEAMEITTDMVKRNGLLEKHLRAVKEHIKKLSQKSYWEQYEASADYVIFFMPNENLYTEALKRDPNLMEEAIKQRILLAHHMSLVGLLRVIALTWSQQKMNENSAQIRDLGKELYDRIAVLASHFTKVGSNLGRTVDSYNQAVRSMESRVLVSARKMDELGVSGKTEIEELPPVEKQVRGTIVRESKGDNLP